MTKHDWIIASLGITLLGPVLKIVSIRLVNKYFSNRTSPNISQTDLSD